MDHNKVTKVTLLGNLTADPTSDTLPSGQLLVRFRLATNHVWQDAQSKEKREQAEFHEVVTWGKLAEIVRRYVRKGAKVYVEGPVQTHPLQDKNGLHASITEVVADNLIMLGHRSTRPPERAAP